MLLQPETFLLCVSTTHKSLIIIQLPKKLISCTLIISFCYVNLLAFPICDTFSFYILDEQDIIETEGSLRISGQWFYRPEEAEIGEGKFCAARDTRELFYSFHIDDVPAESVMHKCIVHFIPQNKQIPARKKYPGFIVQNVYGAAEKKLWNITDKEYDENMQSQINILLKKTIDRIGELPNLEPLCNKDVNVVDVTKEPQACKPKKFLKTEALAISEQNNYAILARYNAITGVEIRDSWLDKLLESIPLASSKETAGRMLWDDLVAASKTSNNLSSAEVTDSNVSCFFFTCLFLNCCT